MVESISKTCPGWATDLLKKLRSLDLILGNIQDPKESWAGGEFSEISKKAFAFQDDSNEYQAAEETTEALFTKVASGLFKEGFSAQEIVSVINNHITHGGRLPYCGLEEVLEVLSYKKI